ncbi:SMP-30/gluconolactonase/LRE family protein [Antrihabitans cavernicola]|uniref:SMP-30/gluconolactonase/LRE family protein n=1 Tax=Antrihabitans cavernicola TaxID=2495913 RepID=A0A5A7SEG8_9NOCA|nr:SMP-30/gluconolactonase/LRE family protein [Spelaeibacter cavernicola]KAA0024550.1 SMP-30/gluconolactonase/LRE family protein [Spelaeibacter cavernicola]
MQTLMTNLGLVESPRWHQDRLWFADWIAGEIIAIDAAGEHEVQIRHRSLPLCFDFLPDGTPLVVSGPENALLRAAPDGSLTQYADLSAFSTFGGGNDIVIDGRGNAYVNNPNYDVMAGEPVGATAPGFVSLVTPDGVARVVADDLSFPNGMAVTADNSTLIVAESHRNRLAAFDIAADGSLSRRRVWADLGTGAPDGICLDDENAVWYADVPNKRCVRVREGGEVADTVEIDRGAFACMLGGGDGKTLFIVAAQWAGMSSMAGDVPWNGQVLSTRAQVGRSTPKRG